MYVYFVTLTGDAVNRLPSKSYSGKLPIVAFHSTWHSPVLRCKLYDYEQPACSTLNSKAWSMVRHRCTRGTEQPTDACACSHPLLTLALCYLSQT